MAERCGVRNGDLLAYLSSADSARDLDHLRAVLGERTLTFVGESVGTLIGQIGMFGQLSGGDIGAMGKALALSVVATMYGAVLANAIAGPIGDKLGMRSAEEIQSREMMLQGILSIQAGDNPRSTMDKMIAFIPQFQRGKLKVAA